MRVDGRSPLTSARPTRGALVATLFAIVTVALVVSFSFAGGDAKDVALDTDTGARFTATPRTTQPPVDTTSSDDERAPAHSDDDGGGDTGEQQTISYQLALSDLGDGTAAFDLDALSNTRALSDEPAAPTTAPPTTAPPATEAPVTTVATPESSTSIVDDPTSTDTTAVDPTATSDPGSTETTVPAETTTTAAPDQPEGYVDAGHGVFVPAVLLEIRRCESTNNYQAANPSSSARGAYQFLRSSWAAYGHADRYGVPEAHLATNAQQDEAALITWQRDGTRPWNASRSCWG